jgi:hypothetical protein
VTAQLSSDGAGNAFKKKMPPRKEKKAAQAETAARERVLKATRDACANTADGALKSPNAHTSSDCL